MNIDVGTPAATGEITVPTGLQPVFFAPSFVLPSSLCSRDLWACPFPPADKNTGSVINSIQCGRDEKRCADTVLLVAVARVFGSHSIGFVGGANSVRMGGDPPGWAPRVGAI